MAAVLSAGSPASVFSFCLSAMQTSCTADPTELQVCDPPCVGATGKEELPSSKVILSAPIPSVSAAISVIDVAVPGPMSLVALWILTVPSGSSLIFADDLLRYAPNAPQPIPYPTSHSPSCCVPGVGFRLSQPIRAAP